MKTWKTKSLGIFVLLAMLVGCASPSYRAPVRGQKHQGPNPEFHRVVSGDTLYSIAWRYNLDFRALAALNKIAKPYLIFPNQFIKLKQKKAPQLVNKQPEIASSKNDITTIENSNALAKPLPIKPPLQPKPKPDKPSKPLVVKMEKPKPVVAATPPKKNVTKWVWPVKGRVLSSFSSSDSKRKGIDIGGNIGSLVRAAADGKVVYSGNGLRGYGNLIIVKHDDDYLSAYAHNRQLLAKENDMVKAGQVIAELGNTEAKRPMLHFEIRRKGKPVNPLKYLPKR